MKESTAYLQIAEDQAKNVKMIASVHEDVTSRFPEGDERDGVTRELAKLRLAVISLQGRALWAAEMALIDPAKDREVKPRERSPGEDVAVELLRGLRAGVCPCPDCTAKRAAAGVKSAGNGSMKFAPGDKVQFRFRNENNWHDGTFNGYSADGSGSLLVKDQCGQDYRAAPDSVSCHPRREENAPTPSPAMAGRSNLDR